MALLRVNKRKQVSVSKREVMVCRPRPGGDTIVLWRLSGGIFHGVTSRKREHRGISEAASQQMYSADSGDGHEAGRE